jgi:predicted TIM-barrel fold metal-dependent hydrolase
MASLDIISADDHIHEPPDLWTSRAPASIRSRVPHVVHEPAADWWVVDGRKFSSFGPGTQTGQRFKDASTLTIEGRADDVRRGAYQAKYRLEDMDSDGIQAAVLYPTVGIGLYMFAPPEIMNELCGAYNDWLAEFCSADRERFHGMCLLNTADVPAAVKELERCKKLGFVGAMIATYPGPQRRYNSPLYEPLWEAAESQQMPLGLHLGGYCPGPGADEMAAGPSTAFRCAYDHWIRMSLADTIFAGVFERHPKLFFGSVEHELGWLPFFIQQIDYMYTQRIAGKDMVRYRDGALPSDFWRRNGYACFQQDAAGIRLRDVIGVDNLMWGSDYPHIESTFPRSQELLRTTLAECTAAEQAKIKRDNARRVFNI